MAFESRVVPISILTIIGKIYAEILVDRVRRMTDWLTVSVSE